MNDDELKDFEDFYGKTEKRAKELDANYQNLYSRTCLEEYRLTKFLYPLLKKDCAGTKLFLLSRREGFNVWQPEIYRYKKKYKQQLEYFTNRATEMRQKLLDKMRAREMFYPDHYDYMVDPRTVNREMHALMPFKDYLFEVLTQKGFVNEH